MNLLSICNRISSFAFVQTKMYGWFRYVCILSILKINKNAKFTFRITLTLKHHRNKLNKSTQITFKQTWQSKIVNHIFFFLPMAVIPRSVVTKQWLLSEGQIRWNNLMYYFGSISCNLKIKGSFLAINMQCFKNYGLYLDQNSFSVHQNQCPFILR